VEEETDITPNIMSSFTNRECKGNG